MAIFSNQATLTYNGNSTTSNIAYGEILDVLTATKTAVDGTYTQGDEITYVVTLRNSGTTALTGLTITDDLGAYPFGGGTVVPLSYVNGTVAVFADGVPQPAPGVAGGPPLVISGISVSAGGSTVVVYQAIANEFANPNAGGTIVNTATITGNGINTPVTATETVEALVGPALTITKSISPPQVLDNDRVTYTFVIRNSGNVPVVATDNATITDTFNPILSALAVTFDGAVWTQGIQYNYNGGTGLFTTVPGQITVPGATYTQDPVTGAYTVNPGIATLTVTGTI